MGPRFFPYLVLLAAIAAYAFDLMGSTSPPLAVMFVLQAAVIASFGFEVLRLRKSRPARWSLPVPTPAKVLVILIALAGAASFPIVFQKMAMLWPTGTPVTIIHWTQSNEKCRVTYNSAPAVDAPAAQCQMYDQSVGLAFGGGWLLFSAIAVWLSYLGARVRHGIDNTG